MSLSDETVWRITQGSELLWKRLEDDFLVYDTGSGNTHLLDLLSGNILQFIQSCRPTTRDLCAHMDSTRLPPHRNPSSSYLENLLERFQRLGLVEPVRL